MSSQTTNEVATNEVKGGISVSLIIQLLRKSILLILILAILGGAGGAVYSALQTKTYSARRTVLMKAAVSRTSEPSTNYSTYNTTAGRYYVSNVIETMQSQLVFALANVIYAAKQYYPTSEEFFTKDATDGTYRVNYDTVYHTDKITFARIAYDLYDSSNVGTTEGFTRPSYMTETGTFSKLKISGIIPGVSIRSSSDDYNYHLYVTMSSAANSALNDEENRELVRTRLTCYLDAAKIVVSLLKDRTQTDETKQKSLFFEADVSLSTADNPVASTSSTNYMSRNVVFGVIIGLALAVFIIILLYVLDDSVKSKEELEAITGVKVFAMIEDMKPSGNKRKHKHKHKSSGESPSEKEQSKEVE